MKKKKDRDQMLSVASQLRLQLHKEPPSSRLEIVKCLIELLDKSDLHPLFTYCLGLIEEASYSRGQEDGYDRGLYHGEDNGYSRGYDTGLEEGISKK